MINKLLELGLSQDSCENEYSIEFLETLTDENSGIGEDLEDLFSVHQKNTASDTLFYIMRNIRSYYENTQFELKELSRTKADLKDYKDAVNMYQAKESDTNSLLKSMQKTNTQAIERITELERHIALIEKIVNLAN